MCACILPIAKNVLKFIGFWEILLESCSATQISTKEGGDAFENRIPKICFCSNLALKVS